jgi:signal transduction histidine kinase
MLENIGGIDISHTNITSTPNINNSSANTNNTNNNTNYDRSNSFDLGVVAINNIPKVTINNDNDSINSTNKKPVEFSKCRRRINRLFRCRFSFRSSLFIICLIQIFISLTLWQLGRESATRDELLTNNLAQSIMDNVELRLELIMNQPLSVVHNLYPSLNRTFNGELGTIKSLSNVTGFLGDITASAGVGVVSSVGFATATGLAQALHNLFTPDMQYYSAQYVLMNDKRYVIEYYSPPFNISLSLNERDHKFGYDTTLSNLTPFFTHTQTVNSTFISKRPYWIAAAEAQGNYTYSRNFQFLDHPDTSVITVSKAIYNPFDTTKIDYVVFAAILLKTLDRVLMNLGNYGELGSTYIINEDGSLLSTSVDKLRVYRNSNLKDLTTYSARLATIYQLLTELHMLDNAHIPHQILPLKVTINDAPFTFQAHRLNIQNLNWIVVLLTSDSEFVVTTTTNISSYFIIMGILLTSSLLMLFLATCLSRPISRIVKFMRLLYLSEIQFTRSRNMNTGKLDTIELLRQVRLIQKQWELSAFRINSKNKRREYSLDNSTSSNNWRKFLDYSTSIFAYEVSSMELAFNTMLNKLTQSYEMLESLNQTKQHFIRYIFHEIRVPLNAITLGINELREQSGMNEKDKDRDITAYPSVQLSNRRLLTSAPQSTVLQTTSNTYKDNSHNNHNNIEDATPVPTPFQSIKTFSTEHALISKNCNLWTNEQYELLDVISQQSQVVARILNDVLSLTKIEDGALELQYSPFSIHAMILSTIHSFHTAIQEKQIKCSTDLQSLQDFVYGPLMIDEHFHNNFGIYHDRPKLDVIGDKYRLRQVLANFISNAIKFTPNKGSIHVRLEIKHIQVKKKRELTSKTSGSPSTSANSNDDLMLPENHTKINQNEENNNNTTNPNHMQNKDIPSNTSATKNTI